MSGTEGWTPDEARARARESVRAAFGHGPELDRPPERKCPSCGHEASTWRSRCPACDKRYDRRLPWLKTWMRWALAAGALAIAGVIIADSAPEIDRTKKARAATEARTRARRIAEETTRLVHQQRPVRGRATGVEIPPADAPPEQRLASRVALVREFKAGILTEVRKRIAGGELDPPVRYVHCGPLIRRADGGGLSDEQVLSRKRGRYDCVAVKRDVTKEGKIVAYFGTPFVGVIDFQKGTWVLCQDNKVPGERGDALVDVKLKPECIGAEGSPEVLHGYALPED